jgi:hypothetical protein
MRWLRIAEPSAGPISEADLSLLWQGQRFPSAALQTADGRRVRVLYPGRLAGGAGPDFRDSVVVVGGARRLGDVELHVRASAFQQHGHHLDAAYDRLVLHVVFLDDSGGNTCLANGESVPVASFAPWVERRSADVAAWLTRPRLWQDPCRSAPARLGEEAVRREIAGAGLSRFRSRARVLADEASSRGPEQALWRALLEALGYGGDRAAFVALSERLPARQVRAIGEKYPVMSGRDGLEGALLAVAGLAATTPDLETLLPPRLDPPIGAVASRPANRPERRLAAAARLLARSGLDLPAYAAATVGRAAGAAELLEAWLVGPPPGAREALLGPARASEVLLNAVLPFCVALPELGLKAESLAAALPPLPPYGKTRFLEENLRGTEAERRRFAASALEQQGLLAYQANWCSQGGCGRCPLS